jgi:succinate-semialdehyde dehydrogenase/glutarate-semialdehyde dehydrogenase
LQGSLDLLLCQIDDTVTNSAHIVAGRKQIKQPGFYIELTVITNISPKNPLFMQETFGLIFSFYTTSNETEAIELANTTKFGFGSSVYSSDKAHAQQVAKMIDCRMVFINTPA